MPMRCSGSAAAARGGDAGSHAACTTRCRRRRRASRTIGSAGSGPLGARNRNELSPRRAPRQRAGSAAAVAAVITISPACRRSLGLDGRRRSGTGDDELPVRVADEEQVEPSGVDADRDAQHDEAGGGVDAADDAQARPHGDRATCGAVGMPVAGEQEQHGVAPELQQAAAQRVGGGEELLEAGVDRVGNFLGTDLAVPREAFRHLGESGDVAEHHGAVDGLPGRAAIGGQGAGTEPVDGQSREVRQQRRGRGHRGPSSGAPGSTTDEAADATDPEPRTYRGSISSTSPARYLVTAERKDASASVHRREGGEARGRCPRRRG